MIHNVRTLFYILNARIWTGKSSGSKISVCSLNKNRQTKRGSGAKRISKTRTATTSVYFSRAKIAKIRRGV
jgi:hypothetical protein